MLLENKTAIIYGVLVQREMESGRSLLASI
jgi:hypothetical protein